MVILLKNVLVQMFYNDLIGYVFKQQFIIKNDV